MEDIKEKIPFNIKLGFLIALVVFILACLFIPSIAPRPYVVRAEAVTQAFELPPQMQQLKEPPPPPKPQMPVAAESEAEVEASTIDRTDLIVDKMPTLPKAEEAIPFAAVEVKPVATYKPHPDYPPMALRAEIEGIVGVMIIVDTTGRVSDAKVIKSLHDALDAAALKAVRTWKFTPARQRDKPVSVRMEIPIRFTLQDQGN